MNSLTEDAMATIMLHKQDYLVTGNTSAAALLKILINCSYLDTNGTVKVIKDQLIALPKYMQQVNSNIELFNKHVDKLLVSLCARGVKK
jgi:hypothetical protein